MSIFTLDTIADATIGPKPARLAVIGHPVGHSLSPQMHQPALDEAGIDARYVALEVQPGEVAQAFARMRELGFIGCNVTVPHKFEALEACDEIDDIARTFGVVNTVRFDPDATRGTNTDGYGFEHAVKEALGLDLPGTAVAIFGAGGGAGGAIAAHCARQEAGRLLLINRTVSKIETLADQLRERHPDLEVHTIAADAVLEARNSGLIRDSSLLVNTSSLGLKESDPSPIPNECLTSSHAVFDTIYHPTALLKAAAEIGAGHANGSLMLLHQGIAAFLFWFPDSLPEAPMRRGLLG